MVKEDVQSLGERLVIAAALWLPSGRLNEDKCRGLPSVSHRPSHGLRSPATSGRQTDGRGSSLAGTRDTQRKISDLDVGCDKMFGPRLSTRYHVASVGGRIVGLVLIQ
jgi:hypothetical protein